MANLQQRSEANGTFYRRSAALSSSARSLQGKFRSRDAEKRADRAIAAAAIEAHVRESYASCTI
jgi:hypothetical protein